MPPLEHNYEEWKEIRSRVDSIANAIFLIGGGALSVSVSVMLSNKGGGLITPQIASVASSAWYWLLASIVLMLLLKISIIFQAFMLQFNTAFVNKRLKLLNGIGWFLGGLGFVAFVGGILKMINAAVLLVSI